MTEQSGNAVDAAVAEAICLAVTRPDVASLAGCGTMIVHDRDTQESHLFDFLCSAPSSFSRTQPNKPATLVGVPGFIRGLHTAHRKFGSLPWADLFKDVIDLASIGFKTRNYGSICLGLFQPSQPDSGLIKAANEQNAKNGHNHPNPIVQQLAGLADGMYHPSHELQATLQNLAGDDKVASFYAELDNSPGFAGALVEHMEREGAGWARSDLTKYEVNQPKAIKMSFGGFTFHSFPAPVAGGPLLLSLLGYLDVIERQKNATVEQHYETAYQADYLGHFIELVKLIEPRAELLGDPTNDANSAKTRHDHVQRILDKASLKKRQMQNFQPHKQLVNMADTGLVVSDGNHLTVALSTFLGSPFGNGELVQGVHLNAALGLFDSRPPPPPPLGTPVLNVGAPNMRPAAFAVPTYMLTPHRKCGIRVGIVASGGLHGILDTVQVISNAALFFSNATCEPPSDVRSSFHPQLRSKANPSPTDRSHLLTSPALTRNCLSLQPAVDQGRLTLTLDNQANANGQVVLAEPNLPASSQLTQMGLDVQTARGDWPSRVAVVGWNSRDIMAAVDRRGDVYLTTHESADCLEACRT